MNSFVPFMNAVGSASLVRSFVRGGELAASLAFSSKVDIAAAKRALEDKDISRCPDRQIGFACTYLGRARCALEAVLDGENEFKRLYTPCQLQSAGRLQVWVLSSLVTCNLALEPKEPEIAQRYLEEADRAYRVAVENSLDRSILDRIAKENLEKAKRSEDLVEKTGRNLLAVGGVLTYMVTGLPALLVSAVADAMDGGSPEPPTQWQFEQFKAGARVRCSES